MIYVVALLALLWWMGGQVRSNINKVIPGSQGQAGDTPIAGGGGAPPGGGQPVQAGDGRVAVPRQVGVIPDDVSSHPAARGGV